MRTCEASATRALDGTSRGSFDFARRLASLRMTLHSVIAADQVEDSRVSRSGRIATDRKAVQRRGPGRVVLGSKPQLATTKKLVRWAGDSTHARSLRLQKKARALGCRRDWQEFSRTLNLCTHLSRLCRCRRRGCGSRACPRRWRPTPG